MSDLHVSQRRIAANRRNALKSTGPHTPAGKKRSSLNALKHGLRGKNPQLDDLIDLGEDPRAFEAFRRRLEDSLDPSNHVEAQLVADIVGLWWKKGRADRAQVALQWRELEKLETDCLRRYHEIQREPLDARLSEVIALGLRGQKESQAKFEEAYAALENLLKLIDHGEWTDELLALCNMIYGDKPNWRGYRIREILVAEIEARKEASAQEKGEESERDNHPETATHPEPSTDRLKELRMLILQELNEVAGEARLYQKDLFSITTAMRRSCFVPDDPRWRLLVRHEAAIERQIEHKLKLYLLVKNSFRRLDSQGEGRRVKDVNFNERTH